MSLPDDDLTPELRDALRALPREATPGRVLEERTVRALRAQQLLAPPRRLRFPAAWVAGAAAACLSIFAGGVVMGQRMAMNASAALLREVNSANARQAALMVQQTGSAYTAALARLDDAGDTLSPDQRRQGREVAVQAFRAAANELVRLAPDDPVAAEVLAGFDRVEAARRTQDTLSRRPEVVWY